MWVLNAMRKEFDDNKSKITKQKQYKSSSDFRCF